MPAGMQPHEGEVAAALDLTDLGAHGELFAVIGGELEVVEGDVLEGFLAGPLERFGPGAVAEPVADEVGVALEGALEGVGGGEGCEGRGGEGAYRVNEDRDFF